MGANFTPDFQGYTNMKPFKFWCQKVLPTIYDDSLSYYEVLCKLVKYLNTVIENMEKVEANTDALLNAFNLLQGWVNDYFDNLDVQDEIDNKLDRMVEDGTFDRYIQPIIESYEGDLQALLNQYASQAQVYVQDSEAWAKGTKNGVDVPSTAPQYHNNSKYWAEQSNGGAQRASNYATQSEQSSLTSQQAAQSATSSASSASSSASDAQAAKTSAQSAATDAETAKTSAESAATDARTARTRAESAATSAQNFATQASLNAQTSETNAQTSEAWAVGTKNNVPVPSTDPQYNNSAKYWAEQAQQAAQNAGTAVQDAESAVADAEDAKQAAEDAQEAAEQAAQSIDLKGNIYVVHVSNCTVYDIDAQNTSFVCSDSPAFDLYNLAAQYHAPVFALPHDVNAGYTFTLAGNRYMSGRYIPQWHVLDAVGNPVTAGSTVSFDIYLIPQDKCTESNGSNYVPQ